ncbi:MAG: hypothetical protein KAU16_06870 [Methanophagales archaeon]|nr:hypothetical protein [Methanophagales archaeon]
MKDSKYPLFILETNGILLGADRDYARAAAMTDSKAMPKEERRILIQKLNEIDRAANYSTTLEEEQIDAYDTTIKRLKAFTDVEFAKKLEKKIKRVG